MSDYDVIGLYPHNINTYEKIKKARKNQRIYSIIQATGTGKTYNALQLSYDEKQKNIIMIVPNLSIKEHIENTIKENKKLDRERDFLHFKIITYQSLINLSREEISNIKCDILIVDEIQFMGTPVWGERVRQLEETHKDMELFGMTAYKVRRRGTEYEKDVTDPNTDEVFSNSIVSEYDLVDAILDKILPKPNYKSSHIKILEDIELLKKDIEKLDPNTEEFKEYQKLKRTAIRRIHEAPSIPRLLQKTLIPNGKYYYFCPTMSEKGVNDIETIKKEIIGYLKEFIKEEDIIVYTTTSEMGEEGRKNREAFYNDTDLDGNDVSDKFQIMFAINQYNLGVHAPNVNGCILGRETKSDIVYFELIGRALSINDNYKLRKEYETYSLESLLKEAEEKEIKIRKDKENDKDYIISKILSPTIIDLAGNYEFIKELEDNLIGKAEEIRKKTNGVRTYHLDDLKFDIEMENQDLFDTLQYLKKRVTPTWEDMYEYAKIYYEHYGNLEVSKKFKTNDGYNYNENGIINLGKWIAYQRRTCPPESEKGKLLLEIGMRFEKVRFTLRWEDMYEYAKIYYEHYGNLEVPYKFKTNDGYTYDEKGTINLEKWIEKQRRTCPPESERGKLLLEIGMRFENKKSTLRWEEMYEYAKIYYEYHGDLEVPQKFKTNDGYTYDEKGTINLGKWIAYQRRSCSPESERGKLLLKLKMRFNNIKSTLTWEDMYEYAKIYYEHHGDLEVPYKFRTNDGYTLDENGVINLGTWIDYQRRSCSPESERGKLLLKLKMRFNNIRSTLTWEDMYEYARIYYEYHGDLEVPKKFKTNDGYRYDEKGIINLGTWIAYQRRTCPPESERGKLLLEIGMRFEKIKSTLTWEGMYGYAKIYYEHHGNLEVPGKFKTNDGYTYDENGTINLGQWIDHQRIRCNPESERGKLLIKIKMRFENKKSTLRWEDMYEYAKIYYEHHGNLEVPVNFKTNDGYTLDENGVINLGTWISVQKSMYKTKQMDSNRIKLLEDIKIVWFSEKIDKKLQTELITEKNKERKEKEFQNRVYSLLNSLNNYPLPSKEDINNHFLEQLNTKRR